MKEGDMAHQKYSPGTLTWNHLVLDPARKEVIVNGQTHHLTPMECQLLATFIKHPGQILTRKFLMQQVWETTFTEDTRTLEVHVSWLRKKLEPDPATPRLIQTVRGVGYVFGEEW
jgi:DNA-binding response OmpR family regulator